MVLKLAVVGCTSIGMRHALACVGDERVTLVACCDDGYAENGGKTADEVGAEFLAHYKEDFPELRFYSNHKEMLANEEVDIVTCGVSDHRHAEIVVDAANKPGVKGIYCEKPLATTVEDTDRMLEACEANGVVLSVDHTRRFTPLWRYAKEELLDKGAIGETRTGLRWLGPCG
jgi:predicted dehydrogenase